MTDLGENIFQKSKERIDPNFEQLPGVILPAELVQRLNPLLVELTSKTTNIYTYERPNFHIHLTKIQQVREGYRISYRDNEEFVNPEIGSYLSNLEDYRLKLPQFKESYRKSPSQSKLRVIESTELYIIVKAGFCDFRRQASDSKITELTEKRSKNELTSVERMQLALYEHSEWIRNRKFQRLSFKSLTPEKTISFEQELQSKAELGSSYKPNKNISSEDLEEYKTYKDQASRNYSGSVLYSAKTGKLILEGYNLLSTQRSYPAISILSTAMKQISLSSNLPEKVSAAPNLADDCDQLSQDLNLIDMEQDKYSEWYQQNPPLKNT